MSFTLNDPIYVAHSGFYLNRRGDIDPLALATVGFLRSLDTPTAKFCLYLLLRRQPIQCQSFFATKPSIEVRKKKGLTIVVDANGCPENPLICVSIDQCGNE